VRLTSRWTLTGLTPEVSTWLCRGQELSYFRSVYINGDKGRHGLVCESYDASTFKYFGLHLVAESMAEGME
jgi:hypothetical protein